MQEEEDLRSEAAKSHGHKAQQIGTILVDDEHQFWPFTGEYWRDELGYYRYKLMNKCGRTGAPETAAPTEPTEPESKGGGEGAPVPPPSDEGAGATAPAPAEMGGAGE
jgi:hypothetical protein